MPWSKREGFAVTGEMERGVGWGGFGHTSPGMRKDFKELSRTLIRGREIRKEST